MRTQHGGADVAALWDLPGKLVLLAAGGGQALTAAAHWWPFVCQEWRVLLKVAENGSGEDDEDSELRGGHFAWRVNKGVAAS
ncbi:hypothetical protein E2C01_004661 [Portunus trituberculatus]|uniref:Uncharacterized protein n=1 Tax=Portunus trituberculatus TaxID=210409 RepID=A0A5B7CTK6_PORTR|nr:hypothetical protein [Portunus trituberculatus]